MNRRVKMLVLFFCITLTGCSPQENNKKLSEADQTLTLTVKKDKPIGSYDYLELDKTAAEKLMKEKFELPLPSYLADAVAIINQTFKTEEILKTESSYSILSDGENLTYTLLLSYLDAENKYLNYATIELKYNYLPDKKEVFLQTQEIYLYNATEDEKFHGKELKECLSSFAQLMNVKLDEAATKKLATIETKQTEAKVYLMFMMEEAEKKKTVGRTLAVEYSEGGTPNRIAIITKDFSE